MKRAKTLTASLRRDTRKKEHLQAFMKGLLDNKHAEEAPPLLKDEECWYLPIFGVYHPKKPDQIRGVFDSSTKYNGVSLNDVLMTGPDLTNSLLGILLRFRQKAVAVMADIQQMFYRFKVKKEHRNFLHFLWFVDNDPDKPHEYRMKVHVFGNSSSPAVATYGLRKTAEMEEETFGADMRRFVQQDFYVDDGITSLSTSHDATDLVKKTQAALLKGGNLRLHKIASNSEEVMNSFPQEDLAKDLRGLDSVKNEFPLQRTLGVSWDIKTDSFTFCVDDQEKQNTRRGVLSTVNSLYDPMGFLAPVTIQGKLLLRDVVSTTTDWDAPMPEDILAKWQQWKGSLQALQDLKVPRTYSSGSTAPTRRELHIFADASEKAIATVAYMKTSSPTDEQIGIILGKAKVAPKHAPTMPRLELCAALLATEIGSFIQDNLNLALDSTSYYSDSKVPLAYIKNRTKRFYVYVAHRVQQILRRTTPDQWVYVPTHRNPADAGTRAIPAHQLPNSSWLQGPDFLRSTSLLKEEPDDFAIPQGDAEVRPKVTSLKTKVGNSRLGVERFARFSRWISLTKAIARLTCMASTFSSSKRDHTGVNADDLEHAKKLIIKEVERESFDEEIAALRGGSQLPKSSSIVGLDPYLDDEGLLRVGSRLRASKLDESKHPIIIKKSQHVATLLVRHHHSEVVHQGRHFTEGAIRSAGIWIVGGKRLVSSVIYKCVTCRKLRGKQQVQKMADLPADRLEPGPPFTNVGVDTFGPWEVTTRRTRGGQANNKRWAVLFTCFTTRAVHIEVVEELPPSLMLFDGSTPCVVQRRFSD